MASRTGAMSDAWEKWEGRVVDGRFPLCKYLGYSDGAIFLTEYSAAELGKATIRLIPDNTPGGPRRLSQWEAVRKLSHPHLLRLYAAGRERLGSADFLYVVSEFADENLGQVLRQRPLTPSEARDMLQPVLEALTFLHGAGLVHGELKPANIMAVDDQLKLSSESIRPVGENDGRPTHRTAYDAPETAGGEKTPAADIWALGVTLVEALTQSAPSQQAISQAMGPKSLAEPFPHIVRHCLVSDPDRRWTAAAIAAWLRPDTSRLGSKDTEQATDVGPHRRLAGWRYRILMIAMGVVVVWVLGGRMFKHTPQAPAVPASAPASEARPAPPTASQQSQQSNPNSAPPSAMPKAPTSNSAGRAAGSVVEQVMPAVPKTARDTIQGHIKVAVRVAVDGAGNVTGTKLVTPGPSKYFAGKAVEASRRWKFKAAEENGRGVASAWLLHFEFSRKGTTVHPMPATH